MTPPDPNVDTNPAEQIRKRVGRMAEEIARLSEMDLEPGPYHAEVLQRLLVGLAAPAGAIWVRTPQGNLQLQHQVNMRDVGVDRSEASRQSHDELLRTVVNRGQPGLLPPHTTLGPQEGGGQVPGNPTDHVILVAPIVVDKQVSGLLEIWHNPDCDGDTQRNGVQFLVRMASLVSVYLRNYQRRLMTGQQQVWAQLEAFARQVHNSLHPTEVAYHVANEGRRLLECDRVSVGLRLGKYARVEAISGADIIEKRSNLVVRMRKLFNEVLAWGERLVYRGIKDDSLPPKVLAALDAYLAESNSKLLVVLPQRDEREKGSKKPVRSALMVETFEPQTSPEQLLARLEVVSRHATPALYNSAEHRRIPFRFLWVPLAAVQEGLGGKAKAIIYLVTLALAALITCLVVVPYPLKMDATGQLLPKIRAQLYPPYEGQVVEFGPDVRPGSPVALNQEVVLMRSLELGGKIRELQVAAGTATREIDSLSQALQKLDKDQDRSPLIRDLVQAQATYHGKALELQELRKRTNASLQNPGEFWLKSPIQGIVLSSDFKETLTNRMVKPNEALLRIGYVTPRKPNIADWEVELKVPQKHIGQVLSAYPLGDFKAELDVDILLVSSPTRSFKGKLTRLKVAAEATPDRNAHDESEPVVMAWLRLSGPDIPPEVQLPPELLLTGTEVHARIRCGTRPMGYSLFYGVWEFLYEKVIFFF